MKIGSVKEIKNNEFRVGLTPSCVINYTNAGHEVYIERGVGNGSGFTDAEYEAAGAKMVDSAKIVILGGGNVGTNACKIAVGMGADVTILDINLQRLEYLDDIFGSRIQTLVSTNANIEKEVKTADVVVGSVLIPGKAAPKIFKKKYLKEMKPGSVFVDVAVDQGGCGETTRVTYHDNPVYIEDGIVHYCVGNMPGAVPRTSTIALTNATLCYGLQIANKGLEEACKANDVICSAINTYDGKLTCKNVADSFEGYVYTDIRTLL